jgi:AcrR family transcriptional regulator
LRANSRSGGAPPPRTKPAEVRREELLEAAEKIFLAKGIAKTSVDEIVVAAGVAKGTFYLHFESKAKLLAALRDRFVANYFDDFRLAMERRRSDDYKGRLRAWVDAGVNGYLDRAALHDLVFHEFRPETPQGKPENPIVTLLASLLADGERAGAWTLDAPELTAVMLFSALHGVLDECTRDRADVNRKRLIRSLETFFHRALAVVDRR